MLQHTVEWWARSSYSWTSKATSTTKYVHTDKSRRREIGRGTSWRYSVLCCQTYDCCRFLPRTCSCRCL